jgi:ATP synthase subunit 6
MFSPLEQFDVIPLIFISYKNYDLTFFNIFLPMIIIIIFFFLINSLKFYYKLIPYSIQIVIENLIEFIFNIIKGQIGKEGYLYFPFIFTIFSFVLIANLLSIIPFGIALTSHLIVTMWLSLSICSGIFILGLYYKNIEFLKIFIPKCPLALLPILILIEIFSYIIRAFSLSIRLTANILAGHTLVNIISVFLLNSFYVNIIIFFIGFLGIFAVLLLELGVACLQAYVLTILICIYLKDVLSSEGH